jgi:hypothetical protein
MSLEESGKSAVTFAQILKALRQGLLWILLVLRKKGDGELEKTKRPISGSISVPPMKDGLNETKMKRITIIRVPSTDDGTFGVMLDEKVPFCLTLERKWQNNEQGVSCIPEGFYVCERVKSPKFGDTFEVKNVSGRISILIHKGNIDDDSHGCILVGEQFEPISGKNAIQASGHAFTEFLQRTMGFSSFELLIKSCDLDNAFDIIRNS